MNNILSERDLHSLLRIAREIPVCVVRNQASFQSSVIGVDGACDGIRVEQVIEIAADEDGPLTIRHEHVRQL